MGRSIHYCECGEDIFDDMESCSACESKAALHAGSESGAAAGYAKWRRQAIGEIARLCEEALDHDTSWPMFCALVQQRLETETALPPSHTDKLSDSHPR